MKSKGSSKNNIANRGSSAAIKKVNDKEVKPVLYKGSKVGHGNYIAAKFDDGSLVLDASGKPTPYQLLN